jgi:hypothetical protein
LALATSLVDAMRVFAAYPVRTILLEIFLFAFGFMLAATVRRVLGIVLPAGIAFPSAVPIAAGLAGVVGWGLGPIV